MNQLKDRYLLSVITNGNVIAKRIGFEHFQLSLRGGEQGRAKPHQDLFHQTAHYFGVKPGEIYHIRGQLNHGCSRRHSKQAAKLYGLIYQAKTQFIYLKQVFCLH